MLSSLNYEKLLHSKDTKVTSSLSKAVFRADQRWQGKRSSAHLMPQKAGQPRACCQAVSPGGNSTGPEDLMKGMAPLTEKTGPMRFTWGSKAPEVHPWSPD